MNSDGQMLARIEGVIDEIKDRIARHRVHIAEHETRTRVILIDPVLRALGWDTEDPGLVVHEYGLGGLKVDYSLMCAGNVAGIVEAKVLGSKLNDADWGKYVAELPSLPLIAFTNGDEWRVFRRSNKWRRETIKLSNGISFKSGFELYQCLGVTDYGSEAVDVVPDTRQSSSSPTPAPAPVGMVPLPTADYSVRPELIKFEDGTERAVTSWGRTYVEIARYVVSKGLVETDDLPVALSQGPLAKKCALNSEPVHPHGIGFYDPVQVRDGVWLERGLGSIREYQRYSVRMLERFGIDPMTVHVARSDESGATESPQH